MADELKFTEGPLMYQGKMIEGNGKRKDGSEFTRWKLMFQSPIANSQFPMTFHTFGPSKEVVKGTKLEDLKEGQRYKIMYSEYALTGERTGKFSKTAIQFYHESTPEGQQKTQAPAQEQSLNMTKFAEWAGHYKDAYLEMYKDNPTLQNSYHFIGGMVKNAVKKFGDKIPAGVVVTLANAEWSEIESSRTKV